MAKTKNPENWVEIKIGDFCFVTKLAGFEYTKNIFPNLVNKGIPLFKGKNVQSGELVLEFDSYIPKNVCLRHTSAQSEILQFLMVILKLI